MRLCISIRGRVRSSVHWSHVVFEPNVLCSDDDEIWHGPRDSQGQFINDIKMLERRSFSSSDVILREESERKWTISADEVVAPYEPRGSCLSIYLTSVRSRWHLFLCVILSSQGHISRDCPDGAVCYNCGINGHIARECTEPPKAGEDGTIKNCYNCKKDGHIARNCPDGVGMP